MFDGISAVSGTYRQIFTAFGLDSYLKPRSKKNNLTHIHEDIARTPFFSQTPGDYEAFAQLWIDFDSSMYTQGDTVGSLVSKSVGNKLKSEHEEQSRNFSYHESSYAYLNEFGEASGISCYTVRDKDNASFRYTFISIMHDATGSPDERTVHVISNLPTQSDKSVFQEEKCPELKPQKIKSRQALLEFLKEHTHSDQVYAFLEDSLDDDCIFNSDQKFEVELIESQKAKQAVQRKILESLDSAPDDDDKFLVSSISELRQSIYVLYKHGLNVSKDNPIKGQKIIDFSKSLNMQAKIIANSKTQEALLENKNAFQKLLQTPKDQKGEHAVFWHRGKLKILVANIGIALTGVGLIAIAVKIIHGAIVENRFLPFWGKTTSEELSNKTKAAAGKITFSRRS